MTDGGRSGYLPESSTALQATRTQLQDMPQVKVLVYGVEPSSVLQLGSMLLSDLNWLLESDPPALRGKVRTRVQGPLYACQSRISGVVPGAVLGGVHVYPAH